MEGPAAPTRLFSFSGQVWLGGDFRLAPLPVLPPSCTVLHFPSDTEEQNAICCRDRCFATFQGWAPQCEFGL